MKLFRIVNF